MKLFWTEPAIQDLRDLRDYIAADFVASIISRPEPEQRRPPPIE
jgi:plasmid stabilization system protein ParE